MWILLIIIVSGGINGGAAIEQLHFATYPECTKAKQQIDQRYKNDKVNCFCMEVDQ